MYKSGGSCGGNPWVPHLTKEVNEQIRGSCGGNPWVPHLTKEVNVHIKGRLWG